MSSLERASSRPSLFAIAALSEAVLPRELELLLLLLLLALVAFCSSTALEAAADGLIVVSDGGGGETDIGSSFAVNEGEYRTEVAGVSAEDEVVLAVGSGLWIILESDSRVLVVDDVLEPAANRFAAASWLASIEADMVGDVGEGKAMND